MSSARWVRGLAAAVVMTSVMTAVSRAAAEPAEPGWIARKGHAVVVEKQDGSRVTGKLVAVEEGSIEVEGEDGSRSVIEPSAVKALRTKLRGQQVIVTMSADDEKISGKLVESDEKTVVVETDDGGRSILDRASIKTVRERSPSLPAATPESVAEPYVPSFARLPPPAPVVPAKPRVWGFWMTLTGGPAWGPSVGFATGTGAGSAMGGTEAAPVGTFILELAGSFHFVYVAAGLSFTGFSGGAGFENNTTGGVMSASSPVSWGGYIEGGLTKGLFISTSSPSALELRPSVGFGYWAMQSPTQSIDNCSDCDTRTYDYNNAAYVRVQLGIYYARRPVESLDHHVFSSECGFFTGPTVSLQQFVVGAEPRLQRILLFGYTIGVGP